MFLSPKYFIKLFFRVGGEENVNTDSFRRAIYKYIQAIKGIRHDDYNYREVCNNSLIVHTHSTKNHCMFFVYPYRLI